MNLNLKVKFYYKMTYEVLSNREMVEEIIWEQYLFRKYASPVSVTIHDL